MSEDSMSDEGKPTDEITTVDSNRRTLLLVGAAGLATSAGCIAGEFPTAGSGNGESSPSGGNGESSPSGGNGESGSVQTSTSSPGIYGPPEWPAALYEDECKPNHFDREGRRILVNNECPLAEHPRHSGSVIAMDWSDGNTTEEYEPADFDYLGFNWYGGSTYHDGSDWNLDIPQEELDSLVDWLEQQPEGRRGLTMNHSIDGMVSGGWHNRDLRDAPVMTTISRDIDGEHDEIPVEPLPTDWHPGDVLKLGVITSHDIPFDFEDHITLFNLPGSGAESPEDYTVEEGTTMLPVTDPSQDGPVEITAEKGDPVVIAAGQANSFWMYHTVQNMRYYMEQVREALQKADVELDYLVCDSESSMIGSKKASENDPRWDDPTHGFGGMSIAGLKKEYGWDALRHWSGGPVKSWTLSAGIFHPMKEAFPDLKGSDYGSIGRNPVAEGSELEFYLDYGGFPGHFGTHGSQEYYARGGFGNIGGGSTPDPVVQVQSTVGHLRGNWWAAGGKVQPWIGLPSWEGDAAYSPSVSFTPYYDEMIYQIGLHEPDPIMVFGHGGEAGPDHVYLDGVLEVLNEQLNGGFSLLTAVNPGTNVNSSLDEEEYPGGGGAVTGARLEDGTGLWRITAIREAEEYEWSRGEGGEVDGTSPIGVTVEEGDDEVDTFEVGTDEVGTWWRYDEANADFDFSLQYAD